MPAVLPGWIDGAVAFSERVRLAVESAVTPTGSTTLLVGVVQILDGEELSAALERADRQLRNAKRVGRNRVSADR